MPWVLDGEYGGSPKRVKVVNYNKAIKIMSGISKIDDFSNKSDKNHIFNKFQKIQNSWFTSAIFCV